MLEKCQVMTAAARVTPVNNTTRPMNLDVGTAFDRASVQFQGLNPREPGQWPPLPKIASWVAAALVVERHRGLQSRFQPLLPEARQDDAGISALLIWLQQHHAKTLDLEQLAARGLAHTAQHRALDVAHARRRESRARRGAIA